MEATVRGIGLAIARGLAAEGAALALATNRRRMGGQAPTGTATWA